VKAASLFALGLAIAAGAAPAPAIARDTGAKRVRRAQLGSVRAELRYREVSRTYHGWLRSRIRIWSGGRRIVDRPAGFGQRVRGLRLLSIRDLDGAGPPEVVLHSFSGGAHCCWATQIFTGAHRVTKQWGHGYIATLRDVDGDGKPEFHGIDTAFAYQFASFGQSYFPRKVWSYSGLALHDVTGSFPAEVQADMADHYAAYRRARADKDPGSVRGALAAYAADGFSLGRGEAALEVVLAAVNAGETKPTKRDPNLFPDYYEALRTLLRKLGYDRGNSLRLRQFLSPDRRTWCGLFDTDTDPDTGWGCYAESPQDTDNSQRSAFLHADGKVDVCYVPVPSLRDICFMNWDSDGTVLAYGRSTEWNGVRCTSAPEGITCTLLSGPGAGKGFRINAAAVEQLAP
jgi:hypothetical protein